MLDSDIRKALRHMVFQAHANDSTTVIVEELGILQGASFVDLAVVNGTFSAYEIKSAHDSLARLPSQVETYGKVFERITLVTSERHLARSLSIVPSWWGVVVAHRVGNESVSLDQVRSPSDNPSVDPYSIVQLLWRDEALKLLEELGADRGVRTKSRKAIWKRVCEVCTIHQIKEAVRKCLRFRTSGLAAQ